METKDQKSKSLSAEALSAGRASQEIASIQMIKALRDARTQLIQSQIHLERTLLKDGGQVREVTEAS